MNINVITEKVDIDLLIVEDLVRQLVTFNRLLFTLRFFCNEGETKKFKCVIIQKNIVIGIRTPKENLGL